MDITFKKKKRNRLLGVCVTEDEYDLIAGIAKEKDMSKSTVALGFLRAAIEDYRLKNPISRMYSAKQKWVAGIK
jgi:hypothetical protein